MSALDICLLLSALLVTLVAGLVLTFAIVVMPGIRPLSDRDYLQAFKGMDGVIQRNHPVFMLVWVGSVLAMLVATGLGAVQLAGMERLLLLVACAAYLLGVQLPTATINVPLNNELQVNNLASMSETELRDLRRRFEPTWNRWNVNRTVVAATVSVVQLILLVRL